MSFAIEVRCSKARRRSLSCCSSVRKIVVRFRLVPIASPQLMVTYQHRYVYMLLDVTLSPLSPSPYQREGEIKKEGVSPPLRLSELEVQILSPTIHSTDVTSRSAALCYH